MIRFTKYPPSNELIDYVHYFFMLDYSPLDKSDKKIQASESFLSNHPQGTFDLMFAMRGGIHLSNYKEESFQLSKIFVMAQQEGFFNINFQPNSQFVGIVFYAESFSKLFNLPLAELTNSGMNIEGHLSEAYQEVYHQLLTATKIHSKIQLLNSFLADELSKVDFSFTKFDLLIRSIRQSDGQATTQDLADQANLSDRSLQRKMKNTLGVGPKSFSNIMRFKEVLTFLKNHPDADWQDTLFHCGYYDQAHFIKDFKRYTGTTPRSFMSDRDDLSSHFLK